MSETTDNKDAATTNEATEEQAKPTRGVQLTERAAKEIPVSYTHLTLPTKA